MNRIIYEKVMFKLLQEVDTESSWKIVDTLLEYPRKDRVQEYYHWIKNTAYNELSRLNHLRYKHLIWFLTCCPKLQRGVK